MKHTCHATGCKKTVPPKMFMCKYHWYKLPVIMRNAIWAEYVLGQEITKTPTQQYIEVAYACIQYIEKLEAV